MKFRMKPIIIEAIQFTGEYNKNLLDVYNFIEGKNVSAYMHINNDSKKCKVNFCVGSEHVGDITIKTPYSSMTATHGDYIIKGVDGEFYPCKPNVFKFTYEKVESDDCAGNSINREEIIKSLVEMASDTKDVNSIIEEFTEHRTYKDKIKYLINTFDVRTLHKTIRENPTEEQMLHDDYEALLTTVINRK